LRTISASLYKRSRSYKTGNSGARTERPDGGSRRKRQRNGRGRSTERGLRYNGKRERNRGRGSARLRGR
jgi:hypothetical protein